MCEQSEEQGIQVVLSGVFTRSRKYFVKMQIR
ncbi:hypothetical protein [Prevotella disiens]